MVGHVPLEDCIGVQVPAPQPIRLVRLLADSLTAIASRIALSERCESKGHNMSYTVYILRFQNSSLYIGQTNNLQQRLIDHKNKASRSSKFSKENGEFKLIYKEEYEGLLESMRREKQLKGWTRAKKEALINGNLDLLKKL